MNRKQASFALCALLAATAGGVGCYDDDDYVDTGNVDYAYEYYYPYAYYYPADLMYSSYYWTDDWYYSDWYYSFAQTVGPRRAIGDMIRALARGEAVCPGQVTVTPRMATPACDNPDVEEIRSGVTIEFTGCQTANGGTITGTIDVQTERMASEATCGPNTRISLSHTTRMTNLSFTGPDGRRLLVPNQTDTGNNTYNYGQLPAMVSFNSSGRIQVFDAGGTLRTDHNHNGTRSLSFSSANRSYTVSGTVNTQDVATGASASMMTTGLTRTSDCCHPTGGTLTVNRTGGTSPGTHTWQFGPTCGGVTFDGTAITAPECL
jgi:Tfp pilus assembly protein FimT